MAETSDASANAQRKLALVATFVINPINKLRSIMQMPTLDSMRYQLICILLRRALWAMKADILFTSRRLANPHEAAY